MESNLYKSALKGRTMKLSVIMHVERISGGQVFYVTTNLYGRVVAFDI